MQQGDNLEVCSFAGDYASVGGAPEAYGSRRVCVSFREIAVRIFSAIAKN